MIADVLSEDQRQDIRGHRPQERSLMVAVADQSRVRYLAALRAILGPFLMRPATLAASSMALQWTLRVTSRLLRSMISHVLSEDQRLH